MRRGAAVVLVLSGLMGFVSIGCDTDPPPNRAGTNTGSSTNEGMELREQEPEPPKESAAAVQSTAAKQAAPLYEDDQVDRFRFAQDVTPPHRKGMFRAALAMVVADGTTWSAADVERLARAWELAGPMPAADHVARALYQRLADDVEGGDAGQRGLARMNGTLMMAAANRATRMGMTAQLRVPAEDVPGNQPLTTTRRVCPGGDCNTVQRRKAIPGISPSPTKEQFAAIRKQRIERAQEDLGVRFKETVARVANGVPLTADGRFTVEVGDGSVLVPVVWSPERLGNLTEGAAQVAMELYVPQATDGDQLRFGRIWVTLPFDGVDGKAEDAAPGVVANLCRKSPGEFSQEPESTLESAVWSGSSETCSGVVVRQGDGLVAIAGLGLGDTFNEHVARLLAPREQGP